MLEPLVPVFGFVDDGKPDRAPLPLLGLRWERILEDGQLPSDVVERRSQVVDDIADDRRPREDRRHFVDASDDDVLDSIGVELGFYSIRVVLDERARSRFEFIDVLHRPVPLRDAADQGMGHGAPDACRAEEPVCR